MTTNPMIEPAAAEAALNAIAALFNNCYISIFTGSMPAKCGAASTGTLLSDGMRFGATAFAGATDPGSTGIMQAVANAIASDTNAAASGTAGYFRVMTGQNSGTVIAQGLCGTSGSDMNLNTTTITATDTVACSSFTLTMPDGSGID